MLFLFPEEKKRWNQKKQNITDMIERIMITNQALFAPVIDETFKFYKEDSI